MMRAVYRRPAFEVMPRRRPGRIGMGAAALAALIIAAVAATSQLKS